LKFESFATAAAIGFRIDCDARSLRAIAKRSKNGPQARHLFASAPIYDGGLRSKAAKIGVVYQRPFSSEAPSDLCYYAPWGDLAFFHAGASTRASSR
jgi:hypothetical protein